MLTPRPFTYRYAQPAEYHFCLDSVLFPKFVAERLNADGTAARIDCAFRALDVCAGCGVIGLELAFHVQQLAQMDFLELQSEFHEFFLQNRRIAGHDERFRFIEGNYANLLRPENANRYDLIVSNPPYFMPHEGRLSPSTLQNRCRFFLEGDLQTLLRGVTNALKSEGHAYILMKSGASHGRNAFRDAALMLAGRASLEIVADLRGTHIVELRRV